MCPTPCHGMQSRQGRGCACCDRATRAVYAEIWNRIRSLFPF